LERDIRRRGAFSLYWDSNAFALVNLIVAFIALEFFIFFIFLDPQALRAKNRPVRLTPRGRRAGFTGLKRRKQL